MAVRSPSPTPPFCSARSSSGTGATSSSGFDNLELEIDADGAAEAVDDKTIGVGAVTIALASSPSFTVNDPLTANPTITIVALAIRLADHLKGTVKQP